MRFNKNILVVINPEKDEQVALDKAIRISSRLKNSITALVRKKHAVSHLLETLNKKLSIATEKGIEVSIEIIDEKDWFRAVLRALSEKEFGFVIKEPHKARLTDHVFPANDWKLLRHSRHPVLLVRADNEWDNQPVMLCVNGNPHDQEHVRLNEKIIKAGRLIAEVGKSDIHLFSACQSEMQDVAPSQSSKGGTVEQFRQGCRALLPTDKLADDRIFVEPGPAEVLIPDFAERMGAKLVIIGTVARTGFKGVLLGNTAEQVAARLQTDLLVLPPES